MNDDNILRRFGPFLNGEDFERGVVCVGLGLDDPTLGVVLAKVGRESWEPRFGVLGGERRDRGKEEGDERD